MRVRRWSAAVVLVLASLAACAAPPVPQDTYHRLRVPPPANPLPRPPLAGMLEVERLAADGLTAGRPLIYSKSDRPQELQEYLYHFWTEPPPIMLRDEIVDYLRAANAAKAVVTPELRVSPDYVLTGKVKRLERVQGEPPRAVVELELGVRATRANTLVILDTYREEIGAVADTMGAAVDAMNQGLARIFARFVADLDRKI